jgi:peptidoglycan/LPS O-acetylase OafA/YrhL
MGETIRGHIKRRVRWFMAIGFLAWLLIPGWLAVARDHEQPYIPFVAMAIFASAALGLQFFVRCPKCKTRLGQIGVQVGVGILKPKVNFCPYCGVNLDESLPAAPSAAQSLNPIK